MVDNSRSFCLVRDVAGTAVLCTVLEGKVTVRDQESCTGMRIYGGGKVGRDWQDRVC